MILCKQKDCFEVYALVPGLLREEVYINHLFSCVLSHDLLHARALRAVVFKSIMAWNYCLESLSWMGLPFFSFPFFAIDVWVKF